MVDRSIEDMVKVNEQAAEQRQQQIDLLTEQLQFWKDHQSAADVQGWIDEVLKGDTQKISSLLLSDKAMQNMSEYEKEDYKAAVNSLIANFFGANQAVNRMESGVSASLYGYNTNLEGAAAALLDVMTNLSGRTIKPWSDINHDTIINNNNDIDYTFNIENFGEGQIPDEEIITAMEEVISPWRTRPNGNLR